MSRKRQREDKLSSESETERAKMRNLVHSLTLSVTFGDSSPRGRAIGISVRLAQNEKKISFVKA